MRTLKEYAKYLRETHLREYAVYYLDLLKEVNLPLIRLAIERGLMEDLWDENAEKATMERQLKSLQALEDGAVISNARKNLKLWEEDKLLPGIGKNEILPTDLVMGYLVQKKVLFHFLPEFTNDVKEFLAIVQEVEDLYSNLQDENIKVLFRIQKSTERQLKQSEERFVQMVQNIKDYAIFMLDPMGHVQSWNEGIERIKGYRDEEIIGKHISVFYTEDDRKNGVPEYNLKMAEKLGQYESEGIRIKKDGSSFWADIIYTPLYDENKKLAGYSKITRDITKQKMAADELIRLNNFLDSVLENIPNMIFVKDAHDLKFVRFNKAGETLLGYPKETFIGKNDYDFFPKEQADFFTAKDREVLSQNDIIDVAEELIDTKNGEQRWLHTKKIPIIGLDGKAQYLLGISEDITEMRETRLDIERKTKELERSNSELEQFAYVASHDLQEPLRTINSYVQLLAERYKGKLDKDANEFIDFAVDGSHRMRMLINSLLEYSRVNKVKPFEWIYPEKIIRSILQDMKDQVEESGATIEYDNLPKIFGDSVLIGQLFQNLIGNALKFRDGKEPEIKISGIAKENEYLFSVEDNGIGIKKEYADKIFVIFQRLNSRDKYPGTGIGLSICKKIVERHGGKIWVEPKPGGGSIFYFTIKTTLL